MGANYFKRFGKRLAARDGGYTCHYCRSDLFLGPVHAWHGHPAYRRSVTLVDGTFIEDAGSLWDRKATVDHKVPRAQGGVNTLDNLVLCCRRCNVTKNARHNATQFAAQLEVAV